MSGARLTVIGMFSAPACVIRQYAVNMLYGAQFALTIGKRSQIGKTICLRKKFARLARNAGKMRVWRYIPCTDHRPF
jgi:hypothetical protein